MKNIILFWNYLLAELIHLNIDGLRYEGGSFWLFSQKPVGPASILLTLDSEQVMTGWQAGLFSKSATFNFHVSSWPGRNCAKTVKTVVVQWQRVKSLAIRRDGKEEYIVIYGVRIKEFQSGHRVRSILNLQAFHQGSFKSWFAWDIWDVAFWMAGYPFLMQKRHSKSW